MPKSLRSIRAMRWILSLMLAVSLVGCSSGPVTNEGTPIEAVAPDKEIAEKTEPDTPALVTTPIEAEMTDVAGYQAVIEKHKGKIIVVDFWATWCEPCVQKFPHIVELSNQFPADKVAFVSVSLDEVEDAEKVTEFLTKQGAGEMTNLHSTLDIVDAFEAFDIADGIPNYKLYDTNGEVKYRFALNANEKLNVLVAEELDIKLREMLK